MLFPKVLPIDHEKTFTGQQIFSGYNRFPNILKSSRTIFCVLPNPRVKKLQCHQKLILKNSAYLKVFQIASHNLIITKYLVYLQFLNGWSTIYFYYFSVNYFYTK